MSKGQVLDYSAGFPGAANIKSAGYEGAVRYIGFPDRRKCATAGELADFTANKIGMAMVYENTLTEWRGGYDAGVSGGQRARNHATAIGFPTNRPIYMAIDQDVVTGVEFDTVAAHIRGAASVMGGMVLTGLYGEADAVDFVRNVHACSYFWQTAAWSRGRHTSANLYQKIGTVTVNKIVCDTNDILADDWGQHNYGGTGTMTATDAYNGVAQLIKDMASGQADDLRLALGIAVWTTQLSTSSNPATAEGLLANLSGRGEAIQTVANTIQDMVKKQTIITPDQLNSLADRISTNLVKAGVSGNSLTVDDVEAAVRRVFADGGDPSNDPTGPNSGQM